MPWKISDVKQEHGLLCGDEEGDGDDPEDLLDGIRAEAAERGMSAYVAEAASEELDDLDAEHERRHATRTHAGEAE